MNKSIPLLVLLLGILIFGTNNRRFYGNKNDTSQPFEEIFTEIGYKTVEAALDEFEQHFKRELKLPIRVPPISFTHYFGRFSNLDGEINDELEVQFISDQFPKNHFKITVRPVEYKIGSHDMDVLKTFKLNNGSVARYIERPNLGFNLLVFERVTPDILVQIANSIDF